MMKLSADAAANQARRKSMKKDGLIDPVELKEIIDNLHDEIMIYDDNYRLVYLNKACKRHYGVEAEELIGKEFSYLDEVYWKDSTLPDVYRTGKTVAKRQVTNLGHEVVTISVPIFDAAGNIRYVAQNVNDNAYQKALESQSEIELNQSGVQTHPQSTFVYKSSEMKHVLDVAEKIKNVKSPCLILGETGTGKSHLASYIHRISDRSNNAFVSLNCACMNPHLLESELFGYEKGAFTGASEKGKKGLAEIADGGTLFLDELSEIPYDLQAKMLHFLQEQEFIPVGGSKKKKVDTRIIAATNRSLRNMVESKTFREDLYYRLNTFEIVIPPIRKRGEDIPLLVAYYLNHHNHAHSRQCTMTPEVMRMLMEYSWPGNVREIGHTMEKIVVLARTEEITLKDLPKNLFELRGEKKLAFHEAGGSLASAVEQVEKAMVTEAYAKHKTSVGVAKELKISQPTAYRLIKKYVG